MADYEFLTADNIPAYLAAHPKLAAIVAPDDVQHIDEIGDGNLNLVFRVRGTNSSIILKQALPYVRMTGEGWPMTPERATREAVSLARHHDVAGDVVVEVIEYDQSRYVIAMEDLSDHRVWRDALNDSLSHHGVAEQLGAYVAAVAVRTSVLGKDRTEVAAEIAATQNPDLCIITEDLVFTEPVLDSGRNIVHAGNEADAQALADDAVFAAAMAEAKWRFMTHAEALLHGDLHTGSVMVRGSDGARADSVKVFDSEFAFYGPVAFDLGLVLGNFAFAAARASVLGETERADWIFQQCGALLDAFHTEFLALAPQWQSSGLWNTNFAERRADTIRRESWVFAASEMARRVVGAARVRDIDSLAPEARELATRAVLLAARALAAGWDSPHSSEDFAAVVCDAFAEVLIARKA